MSSEQVFCWAKVGDFKFWYTLHGKPCSDTIKHDSRIELNIAEESFSCWVCKIYPSFKIVKIKFLTSKLSNKASRCQAAAIETYFANLRYF